MTRKLPIGRHPMQLYSLATPNGVQGHGDAGKSFWRSAHRGAEYDAWLIKDRRQSVRQRLLSPSIPKLQDPGG